MERNLSCQFILGFLPHNAMRKRGRCCGPVSVRLSVRLSVCLSRSCTLSRWLKISSNFFAGPVGPFYHFDPPPGADTQFQGNPISGGGAKYKGMRNVCDFRLKLPSFSETARDRPMVAIMLWNVNRKSYALYRMVTFSMTLTDP